MFIRSCIRAASVIMRELLDLSSALVNSNAFCKSPPVVRKIRRALQCGCHFAPQTCSYTIGLQGEQGGNSPQLKELYSCTATLAVNKAVVGWKGCA